MAKENRVTRYADEINENIQMKIDTYKTKAKKLYEEAENLKAQTNVLELQLTNNQQILASGNYENNNAQS